MVIIDAVLSSATGFLVLLLFGVYLLIAFGLRTWLQIRRTGASGFHGLGGKPGSAEWFGGILVVTAVGGGVLGPVLDVAGLIERMSPLDRAGVRLAGLLLFIAGLLATFVAQVAMGDSWRIGVKAGEKTTLVIHGPFAVVRNPIFAAMIPASLGLVLMVPNLVAVGAWLALVTGLELQVRFVEEPHLLQVHGEAYRAYAARVGRFLPWVGRLTRPTVPGTPGGRRSADRS